MKPRIKIPVFSTKSLNMVVLVYTNTKKPFEKIKEKYRCI